MNISLTMKTITWPTDHSQVNDATDFGFIGRNLTFVVPRVFFPYRANLKCPRVGSAYSLGFKAIVTDEHVVAHC